MKGLKKFEKREKQEGKIIPRKLTQPKRAEKSKKQEEKIIPNKLKQLEWAEKFEKRMKRQERRDLWQKILSR